MEAICKVVMACAKEWRALLKASAIRACVERLVKEGVITSPMEILREELWLQCTAALAEFPMNGGSARELKVWGLIRMLLRRAREERETWKAAREALRGSGIRVGSTEIEGAAEETAPEGGEERVEEQGEEQRDGGLVMPAGLGEEASRAPPPHYPWDELRQADRAGQPCPVAPSEPEGEGERGENERENERGNERENERENERGRIRTPNEWLPGALMVPDKSWNQGESAAKDGAGDRERGRRRVTFDSTRRASGRERVSEDEMDSLTRRFQEVYRGGEREGGVRAEEVEEDVEIGLEQALRLMRRLEREVQKQQRMLQRLADTRSQDDSSGEKPRAELYLPDWQLSAGAVTLRGLKLTAPPETPSALPVRLAPGGLIEWAPIDPKAVYEELGKLVKVEPPWTKIKQTHAESFTEFCDRLQRAIAESDLPP
ncbi:uncharacterized protein [Apteryx mantelli]|uniref:Retroviral Gag polyprotein M domain-containing protein n=1 Tax=Apteryx mantelli TaxID=2696672 RepID=A0ABM4EE32_9AVES